MTVPYIVISRSDCTLCSGRSPGQKVCDCRRVSAANTKLESHKIIGVPVPLSSNAGIYARSARTPEASLHC
jgi:hypothetical protein